MRKTCVQPVSRLRLTGGNTVMLSPAAAAFAHVSYAFPLFSGKLPRVIPILNPQTYAHEFTSINAVLYTESTGPITTITMYIKSKRRTNKRGVF
jgi:hypothetical protein